VLTGLFRVLVDKVGGLGFVVFEIEVSRDAIPLLGPINGCTRVLKAVEHVVVGNDDTRLAQYRQRCVVDSLYLFNSKQALLHR